MQIIPINNYNNYNKYNSRTSFKSLKIGIMLKIHPDLMKKIQSSSEIFNVAARWHRICSDLDVDLGPDYFEKGLVHFRAYNKKGEICECHIHEDMITQVPEYKIYDAMVSKDGAKKVIEPINANSIKSESSLIIPSWMKEFDPKLSDKILNSPAIKEVAEYWQERGSKLEVDFSVDYHSSGLLDLCAVNKGMLYTCKIHKDMISDLNTNNLIESMKMGRRKNFTGSSSGLKMML